MRTPEISFHRSRLPHLCFIVAAALFLGTAAFVAATNMIADQPNQDIWQHVAALNALMDNLAHPANPFVASDETSRHFHPLWVATAAFAQAFGLSVWTALHLVTYLSMGLFAGAVYSFARTYFASPWAPLVLLVTLLFGWMIPVQHTGVHAFKSLLFGAAYPATFLISFSLILWAVVMHALEQRKWLVVVVFLVALMFATHQLGAVIGLIGAGCFILLWPGAGLAARVAVSLAVLCGLGLSLFWPYYNPFLFVFQSGGAHGIGAQIIMV